MPFLNSTCVFSCDLTNEHQSAAISLAKCRPGQHKFISFQDKRGTIKKIAEFLGRPLTEEDIDRIVEHTSLQYMKTNDKVNLSYIEKYRDTDKSEGAFINKGIVFTPKIEYLHDP